jgi:ABC-type branched-subunit amino acid transport system ATPase component
LTTEIVPQIYELIKGAIPHQSAVVFTEQHVDQAQRWATRFCRLEAGTLNCPAPA